MQMPAEVRQCRRCISRGHELNCTQYVNILLCDQIIFTISNKCQPEAYEWTGKWGEGKLQDWFVKWGASFKSGYERIEQVLEVGQKWESSFRSRPKSSGASFQT